MAQLVTSYTPGGPVILPQEANNLISQDSWMSYRLSGRSLRVSGGYISPTATLDGGRGEAIKFGLDPGNWKMKRSIIVPAPGRIGAGLTHHQDHYLMVHSSMTTMKYMGRITSGKPPTLFTITRDDTIPVVLQKEAGRDSVPSPRFSIDEDAQSPEVISMPVGPTNVRLSRLNYRRFIQANVADSLARAGYKSGSYSLTLALAVRNEEIHVNPTSLMPQLVAELEPWVNTLYGTFAVQRVDEEGEEVTYTVTIEEIVPYAQTLGTFYAWYYGLNGKPVPLLLQKKISRVMLFDLGGGDTQVLDVACGSSRDPGTQGRRICPGTREIAQLLAQKCKETERLRLLPEMSIAAAQQALISHTVQMGGFQEDVSPQVESSVSEKGGNLITRIFSEIQEGDALYAVTGGGLILLDYYIHEYMATVGRTNWTNYLLFPEQIAGEMNAIGGQAMLSAIYS